MRFRSSIFILLAFVLAGCSGSRTLFNDAELRSSASPMDIYIDSDSSMNGTPTYVAKVLRGNGFIQSGVFISSNGLFATNFSVALEYFSSSNSASVEWLTDGFLSDADNPELPLPGISFMIEVEQIDVTDQYNSRITENSSNREIALMKQSLTQQIIENEKAESPELVFQINELFNGDRFILSKYQIIRDVRLVFAPGTGITSETITDSKDILSKTENLPVFLRAYVSENGNSVPYSDKNVPFAPKEYLEVEQSTPDIAKAQVLGFPEQSFRLEPYQALQFYNQSTNPNIIRAYSAFQAKEERKSWKDPLYAHRSIANRIYVQKNINYYERVQSSFETDSILFKKSQFDADLRLRIESDSTLSDKYLVIFEYLKEAYEIAGRQGESFYASSYFLALSQLDEFARIVREYLNSTSNNSAMRLENLANNQRLLLERTDIQEELLLLADFILIFNNLPESQIPFTIQDIFDENPDLNPNELAEFTLESFGDNTALFDSTKLLQSIESNSLSDDPLFALLDELIFAQEMSRNNQSIFIAYAQPVRQVYADAIRTVLDSPLINSDANGILRVNDGAVIDSGSPSELEGLFNFTIKAFGSAVINENGALIGILGGGLTPDITNNYLFNNKPSSYPVIGLSSYIQQIEDLDPASYLLQELNK